MKITRTQKALLLTLALLFSTLACRAATNLIFPATPTPPPTQTPLPTLTPVPTIPPPTPTIQFEAACPNLVADILKTANAKEFMDTEANEKEKYLVTYTIKDGKLATRDDIFTSRSIDREEDARATHEAIWNYFAAIIPPEQRTFLTEFSVLSDGRGNLLAAVSPTYDNPSNWELEVDVVDAVNRYSLTYTLVHEFGHLLTLNAKQVPPDRRVIYHPEDESIYDQAVAACLQYFPGEGCSTPNSYINQFFNRFWTDFYNEWQEIDREKGEAVYYDELDDFYKTYKDQFLTDYAPTSPAEDIAESWAFFIFSPKPQLDSIAHEKILFFYEYPELVQLREDILNRVCESFPQ